MATLGARDRAYLHHRPAGESSGRGADPCLTPAHSSALADMDTEGNLSQDRAEGGQAAFKYCTGSAVKGLLGVTETSAPARTQGITEHVESSSAPQILYAYSPPVARLIE